VGVHRPLCLDCLLPFLKNHLLDVADIAAAAGVEEAAVVSAVDMAKILLGYLLSPVNPVNPVNLSCPLCPLSLSAPSCHANPSALLALSHPLHLLYLLHPCDLSGPSGLANPSHCL